MVIRICDGMGGSRGGGVGQGAGPPTPEKSQVAIAFLGNTGTDPPPLPPPLEDQIASRGKFVIR